ncbi:hypothetical protein SHIRM173S_05758 [Streptomyces hirsutus]
MPGEDGGDQQGPAAQHSPRDRAPRDRSALGPQGVGEPERYGGRGAGHGAPVVSGAQLQLPSEDVQDARTGLLLLAVHLLPLFLHARHLP